MSDLVILPTARWVAPEMQTEFGLIPPAMVPLDGRPAMHYISKRFIMDGNRILLAAHQGVEQIRDHLQRTSDEVLRVVDVGQTDSLGETISAALDSIPDVRGRLIVSFADTFVGDDLPPGDVVCFQELDELFRWTAFEISTEGDIGHIFEKGERKPFGGPRPVFVGLFAIADAVKFRNVLREILHRPRNHTDPFYVALREYFNARPPTHRTLLRVNDWRDFGHLDTYYRTRRAFFLSKRFFNTVTVDERRGLLRKTSQNTEKFIDEIRWYLKLPRRVQHVAPRVLDFSLDVERPYVELEFYGYPALNDVYLYGNIDSGEWVSALDAIRLVLDDMAAHEVRLPPADAERSLRAMYLEKTLTRLKPILDDPKFSRLVEGHIVINGRRCLGLRGALEVIPEIAEQHRILSADRFTIIHGDLCLSNILYDRRNRLVRLVDPRGRFGEFDIYGDPRYDLAKLSHSFNGDYDFLVAGLFDLEWSESGLELRPHHAQRHHEVKRVFDAWLDASWGASRDAIRLIEALLFLSMVPLHKDRFRSQEAFLARGLGILEGVRQARGSPGREGEAAR